MSSADWARIPGSAAPMRFDWSQPGSGVSVLEVICRQLGLGRPTVGGIEVYRCDKTVPRGQSNDNTELPRKLSRPGWR